MLPAPKTEWLKAANYRLQGELKFRGLDVAIENKKGSRRKWYDPHGKESGSTFMHHAYGYIRLTEGTDGDHVDVYVGPNEDAAKVFVINQMKKPDFKTFDEQKVMLGFDSAAEAKAAYLKQYNDPKFFGSMKEMDFEEFKTKVLDKKNHGKKIAAVLHTPDAIFGGAAADSQVGLEIDIEKTGNDLVHVLREAAKEAPGAARFRASDLVPGREALRAALRRGGFGAVVGGATGALGGVGYAGDRGYKAKNYGRHVARGAAGGAVAGGLLGASSVPLESLGKHLIHSGGRLLDQAEMAPKVLDAAGNVVHDFGEPLIRKAKVRGVSGLGMGYGSHAVQDPHVQAFSGVAVGRAMAEHGAKRDKKTKKRKTAALSPAVLSHLQHGAVGAGIGAVAGGVGGMLHGGPENRGKGLVRGALVGAGLGAAGGAGISAIKQHGATQLSSLRAQAGKAHQDAVAAHGILQRVPAPHGNPALAQTQHAGLGAGTMAAKPGVAGPLELNTQGKAVMDPRAWGAQTPPSISHEIASTQAAGAGSRAEALRQAAERLGQQHQVMNRGINRAALTGAAAGTSLMGYMAVPRERGGVGIAPQKTASDREHRIADRLDDVGIGMLASPYIADVASGGLKKLMLRGGRTGALAAEGHTIADAVAKKLHNNPAVELGGLALVAPGIGHGLARGINKVLPRPHDDVVKAAAEAGRVLANADHETKLSGMGRLALGIGAVGATGAALYGGKKAIDATKTMATHSNHAKPAQYVGVPPGMRPPSVAGY